MNTIGYFEIQSSQPERDVRFYNTVFGWHFERQHGIPAPYFSIETTGITGGLLQRPVNIPSLPAGTNACVCSVQVDNFDATSALILANGGQVAMHKFAIPGRCWQGYFLDKDRNTFGIFQDDDQAA